MAKQLSRRAFLTASTTTVAAGTLAACASEQPSRQPGPGTSISPIRVLHEEKVEFFGTHQAGVVTPAQANLNLIAFTVRAGVDKAGIRRLLRLWTADASRLCAGQTPLGDLEPELTDTPANLTITCGFGPRLFDIIGAQDQRPDWLAPIKQYSRDKLDPKWGEADLVVQLCCDDPLMLAHATRHMVRAGADYVATKWVQRGFLHAYGAKDEGQTPRNLFGQVDGTVNPRTPEEQLDQVWIDEGPDWARNGSCMVVRRIAMNLDTWEILDRESREVSMGRKLSNGAPLTGDEEFDQADFAKTDSFGLPVIDPMSHMARSHPPADHPEQRILRRAYNYDLPPEPGSEQLSNSGLVFICFQKNPKLQFEAIQQRLDEGDRLNQWITHIGSAVFFIPPGVQSESDYWGAELLGEHQ
ncbi:Dyp-type peroxidase [Corynebacterium epidermidicanis]|uniref:Dyp-type peroxidase family n=1 Tax=Corynebacterium epidermidicanis TaxID=1050174 RepID=A0A0G3GQ07_9CORY|nr:Dyp-type peroxidase [Corynebacterium epidermidicanis]AKK03291.1 Dyp-type peroxidase family [Corynebacterium epidermidicanis]